MQIFESVRDSFVTYSGYPTVICVFSAVSAGATRKHLITYYPRDLSITVETGKIKYIIFKLLV